MQREKPMPAIIYVEPAAKGKNALRLVAGNGTPHERRFTFYSKIEIGRYHEERERTPGFLFLSDPMVSSRHCVITRTEDGLCYIRDTSRNGTRVDGRRLVPNVEVEIKVGQTICVANEHEFLLAGEPALAAGLSPGEAAGLTVQHVSLMTVTVLVGDIRDYTKLVQRPDSIEIQKAIGRVFHKLENEVTRLGGAVKEYRGDAILAFWQEDLFENQAVEACRAALSLNRLATALAADRSVWHIPDVPFKMDWALATGSVSIASIGGDRPTGLSLIGPPVVLAFRIEKYADNATSPIVACPATRERASVGFEFKELGDKYCKGFDAPAKVYALIGPR